MLFLCVEEVETTYEIEGGNIHQYSVSDILNIGVFVRSHDIDIALSEARTIKDSVVTKIKTIEFETKPIFMVSVKKDKK